MGLIGSGLTLVSSPAGGGELAGVQKVQFAMTAVAAVFLFGFGLMRLGIIAEPRWMSAAGPQQIPGFSKALRSAARGRGLLSVLLLGLLLGLLPCGLSYAAFARALPAGGPLQGALLVLVFGIGTVPALLLLGTVASRVARRYRQLSDVLSALLLIGMAAALLLKALA